MILATDVIAQGDVPKNTCGGTGGPGNPTAKIPVATAPVDKAAPVRTDVATSPTVSVDGDKVQIKPDFSALLGAAGGGTCPKIPGDTSTKKQPVPASIPKDAGSVKLPKTLPTAIRP